MKHFNSKLLLTLLLLMCTTITFAHDIAVANSDGDTIYYNINSDGSSVSVTDKGTSYISYSNEYSGELVIPESVTYSGKTYSVTSIGASAFYNCSGLTSVTIPNSVTSIGSYAFGNTKIKSLTIGTGIQTISSNAFYGANPVKVIWLANTPPSGYKNVGGTVNYVPNNSYSWLSGQKIYSFLSSMFEVDGIKYVPVSPSERTCDAIDCVYNESTENIKIGNTVTYKNITMTVKNVGDHICSGNKYIKTLEYTFDGYIGSSAFYVCSGLTSVTIGNGVTSIGEYAFYGCSGLTSVAIPNSVTSIGEYAFSGCNGLTSVAIPNSMTSIGEYAFYYCRSLTSVTIPNSVTSIGSSAFSGCRGLTSVTIPNSVTSIGRSAFSGCSGLTSVTIPNSVTSIGEYAFSDCTLLTSVTIPNSVTGIGSSVFSGSNKLTSIIWNAKRVPDFLSYSYSPFYDIRTQITQFIIGNEVTSIPGYLCYGMEKLKSVTIPKSVTSIGKKAFDGCRGLTSIIWNAKIFPSFSSYSSSPFYDINTKITEFIIGDEVTNIPGYLCYRMSNLKSVTIPKSVTSIGEKAFYGCSRLTSIIWNAKIFPSFSSYSSSPFYDINTKITEFIIGDEVTNIPGYLCYRMSNLKSVTIPKSVTSIGEKAFYGCSGLNEVHIKDLSKWYGINFGDVNANPLYYAHRLFLNGEEIHSLTIPSDVTSIKNYAFIGCSSLTSVTIPDHVTSIGSFAFGSCSGLNEVHIKDLSKWCGINFSNADANPLCYAHRLFLNGEEIHNLTIPSEVTSIKSYAFYRCSGLISVTIPDNVTSIGISVFQGCSSLKETSIGNGVTSIGNSAFQSCGLVSITIPDHVTSIGSSVFQGCSSLKEVSIGKGVTSIPNSAFQSSGLVSITIPDHVTSIGSSVFQGCSRLKDVTIGNGITSINNTIFSSCTGLKTLILKGGKDDELQIDNKAFSSCPLDSVYISRNITYSTSSSAGYSPFYRNTTLRTVHITSKESEISENEFYGCTNLKNITIDDGVKTIGSYAFSGCSSLEYFACGTQVESIGKEAFSDCTAMTTFRSKSATPPRCGQQALDDINKWECTLQVPRPSIEAYQGADQWKNFFFVETKPADKGDANGDDAISMADANAVVNYFLAKGTSQFIDDNFDENAADVNNDGQVTMADANQIVNMFLEGEK